MFQPSFISDEEPDMFCLVIRFHMYQPPKSKLIKTQLPPKPRGPGVNVYRGDRISVRGKNGKKYKKMQIVRRNQGVTKIRSGKFRAIICINNKQVRLGTYVNEEDAIAAYRLANENRELYDQPNTKKRNRTTLPKN
jgi:hypothetical protein